MNTKLTICVILTLGACTDRVATKKTSSPQQEQAPGNRWLPLDAGTLWIYEGDDEGYEFREVVTAHDLEYIPGIGDCTPLWHDTYLNNVLAERSVEWLMTDFVGNVWLVGEQSWELSDAEEFKSTEYWRSDTDTIGPFLMMPADPTVGEQFVHAIGATTDTYTILSDGVSIETPIGEFHDALAVEEQSEPDDVDIILYRPGTGVVHERSSKGSKVIVLHRRPR